ncbi:helix-turn-helix domain-containing protein [Coralliovum pocilloporae]|uniref:helix-turn-helix domain-containing protein n=1 Tax=Coralliovum pocilloporae TaxID=3066369 RepID=UPI0033075CF9
MARDAENEQLSPRSVIDNVERNLEPLKLGKRVREVRRKNELTLEEAAQRTGLARSTLSKIENDQMSPTFDVMQKLAAGLNIGIPQLFVQSRQKKASGRRTLTRAGEGRHHPTPTYGHELLCTALTSRRMVPFKSHIHARDFSEFEDWIRHDGEEFLLVLEGEIEFYSEFYEPVILGVGDSVYYDSGMGHACISTSKEDALILWVSAPD